MTAREKVTQHGRISISTVYIQQGLNGMDNFIARFHLVSLTTVHIVSVSSLLGLLLLFGSDPCCR